MTELEALEAAFEHNGGRGVEDAERLDGLRARADWADWLESYDDDR